MKTILEAAPGALSDYYDWKNDAADGDVLVYWTGDLAWDRDVENFRERDDFPILERLIETLDIVAKRVLDDAKAGFVVLTQCKSALGPSRYEYRATRRRRHGTVLSLKPKARTDDDAAVA